MRARNRMLRTTRGDHGRRMIRIVSLVSRRAGISETKSGTGIDRESNLRLAPWCFRSAGWQRPSGDIVRMQNCCAACQIRLPALQLLSPSRQR